MKARFYVYQLRDPRDGKVFYVGKGQGARVYAHEAEARKGASGAKCDRIRAIFAAGLRVKREVVQRFASEADAYAAERDLIASTPGLTNIRAGHTWALTAERQAEADRLRLAKIAAHKMAKNVKWLKAWLRLVDTWSGGVTFPGMVDGDRKAEELVRIVRELVA